MAIFSFSHPGYLIFLFALPILFFIHFLSLGNRKKTALKFANFKAIAKIQGIDFFSKNIVLLIINILVVTFLILAVSGLTLHTFKQASSFSFVIAIDSSRSMEATDLLPNRLEVSKQTAKDFVDSIPYGSQLGVISFSGNSFIESSVTDDKTLIKNAIDGIQLSGFGGTDLFEAVITGTNILEGESDKAIVLLSDGQINVGVIEEAIDYALEHDVIIHTIAVGTITGGETSLAISKLDEDSLKSVAYNTGGEFFSAQDEATLSESFSNVLQLTERRVAIPLASYLIMAAIILFILEFLLTNTRYFNLP